MIISNVKGMQTGFKNWVLRWLRFIFWGCMVLYLNSCKEKYETEVSGNINALVVDGMITDEHLAHSVRLTRAIRFDTASFVPEKGAVVYVTDSKGGKYFFAEKTDGLYVSDSSEFIPQPGLKYSLTVETKDKKVYQSSEQLMLPRGDQGDLTNFPKVEQFYRTEEGKLKSTNVTGAEFVSSFNMPPSTDQYFRYSNSVLIEYLVQYSNMPKDSVYYTWQSYNPNEYFNIAKLEPDVSQYQHYLGFYPLDSIFYGIYKLTEENPVTHAKLYIFRNVFHYIISFKQYHLNKEIFNYYELLNKQLEARQQMFSPFTFQVEGNIHCVTDSTEKVLGIFEVSSVSNRSYIVMPGKYTTAYVLKEVNFDKDRINASGVSYQVPPDFWIK